MPLDYQLRCRIDRTKRHTPARNLFTLKKSAYERRNDPTQVKKPSKIPANSADDSVDSMKKEIENQFATIEEIPSTERMISAPQGSIASDVQQADDSNDNDTFSDIEQTDHQQPMVDEMNNLNLDANETSEVNLLR